VPKEKGQAFFCEWDVVSQPTLLEGAVFGFSRSFATAAGHTTVPGIYTNLKSDC
jgi:hypothetical protein